MKKLVLAGMVMVFAAGLFAETLTLTGTVNEKIGTNKKTGKETKSYTLSTDEYKKVTFSGKTKNAVKELVGQTVTLEVEATVKDGKKGKTLKVKEIIAVK